MDKKEKWVKDSIYNSRRVIWTNSHIFRLTNFPVMFQTIINKISWNLINTGEVRSFIDNVIVETKKEEGHDKVVEKIVKKLAENDLYVKLEKCK